MDQEVTADNVLQLTGEEDKLKDLLIHRLRESGWEEELKLACSKIIKTKGVENVTLDSLIQEVTPVGREKVPAEVKKELLDKIKSSLTIKTEEQDMF